MTATATTDFAIVVQDTDGAWHLRAKGDEFQAWNAGFAFYACDDAEQAARGVDATDILMALTWTDEKCPKCFSLAAPDWLMEPQAADDAIRLQRVS